MSRLKAMFAGDRWIPWTFVGMFAVMLMANGSLVFFSFDSWTGLSTTNAYNKGLAYNKTIAAREGQRKLGWRIAAAYQSTGARQGRLRLALKDKGGKPLGAAKVSAILRRPTQSGHDVRVTLADAGRGRYQGAVRLPLIGQWEVRYRIERAGTIARATHRIMVK